MKARTIASSSVETTQSRLGCARPNALYTDGSRSPRSPRDAANAPNVWLMGAGVDHMCGIWSMGSNPEVIAHIRSSLPSALLECPREANAPNIVRVVVAPLIPLDRPSRGHWST